MKRLRGVAFAVEALRREYIEPFDWDKTSVRFNGTRGTGLRALDIVTRPYNAERIGMPLRSLGRIYLYVEDELHGPEWRLTWWQQGTSCKRSAECPDRREGAAVRSSRLPDSPLSGGRPSGDPACCRGKACHPTKPEPRPDRRSSGLDSPSLDPSGGDA